MDPLGSKAATNCNLTKVLNTYDRDGRKLFADLTAGYLKTDKRFNNFEQNPLAAVLTVIPSTTPKTHCQQGPTSALQGENILFRWYTDRRGIVAEQMNLLVQLGLCAALATVVLAAGITRTVVVSWDARRNMLRAHNDTAAKDIIAVCVLQDARMDFGWASVYVKTDSRYRDSEQAYAAGFAEGAATSSMTDEQFANVYAHYCDPDPAFCERLFAFYRANLRSMFDNAVRYSDQDPFWHQASGTTHSFDGSYSSPYTV
ncbi:hypothetical protein HPB48_000682 [Haemaphysalis longicornis]|uniref:Phospholipase B-like n=1 Tax=Haemaphysalis longicornis TaxID=44386 RepID=A0A9J6GYF3_HAELO|nr:hypothetical protein HPB48_000682 [Haemaphysalis longicornis]